MKKILVIQTAYIGDVVISTAFLRELKKLFPNSEIDIIPTPISSILFKYCPYVNQVLEFNKRKNKLKNFFKLLKIIKRKKYNMAISIQTSFTSSLLMFLAGIKKRIGFSIQKLLTESIPYYEKAENHRRKRILSLLEVFKPSGKLFDQTELFLSEKEEKKAEKLLKNKTYADSIRYIGLAPGSVRITKKWPETYFADLVKSLKNKNIIPVFIGGKGERTLCERIIKKSGNRKCLDFTGKLNLLESAAVIKKLDLILVNDSAPLHIANAVNTTVFAFFGPTVREYGFFPFGKDDKIFEVKLDCRPCSLHGNKRCPLGHHNCMKLIRPEKVLKSLEKNLREKKI